VKGTIGAVTTVVVSSLTWRAGGTVSVEYSVSDREKHGRREMAHMKRRVQRRSYVSEENEERRMTELSPHASLREHAEYGERRTRVELFPARPTRA
jgi:hypothetical protein